VPQSASLPKVYKFDIVIDNRKAIILLLLVASLSITAAIWLMPDKEGWRASTVR
jgi:hypothetical protein